MTVREAYARLVFVRCLWMSAVGVAVAAALSLMSSVISALSAETGSVLLDATLVATPLWLLLYSVPMFVIGMATATWRDFFGGPGIRMNWTSFGTEAAQMSIWDWFNPMKTRNMLRRARQPAIAG